jgi:hypothetical protein
MRDDIGGWNDFARAFEKNAKYIECTGSLPDLFIFLQQQSFAGQEA